MTNKEIAELGGVTLSRCEPEFGGTWAYATAESPNTHLCGYRTENAAIKAFLENEFPGELGKLCLKLLRKHQLKGKK